MLAPFIAQDRIALSSLDRIALSSLDRIAFYGTFIMVYKNAHEKRHSQVEELDQTGMTSYSGRTARSDRYDVRYVTAHLCQPGIKAAAHLILPHLRHHDLFK